MNQKRKAELQRKLSMAPVRRPPDGLADRIKSEIPDLTNVQRDRERLSHSVAFNVRVAASILLLVSSAFLTIHLLSRSEISQPSSVAVSTKRAAAPTAQTNYDAPARPMETAEVTVTIAEAAPAARSDLFALSTPQRADRERVAANELKATDERRPVQQLAGGVAGGAIGVVAVPPAAAPVPASVPPPADSVAEARVEADAAEEVGKAVRKKETALADAITLTRSAQAADLMSPRTLFGISVDPNAFERVKEVIESGAQPVPSMVDIDALVNYFAGPLPPAKQRDVRIEVEASRAPVGAAEDSAILRYTIDTKATGASRRPASPPVATNVILQIQINPEFVAHHRVIGAGKSLTITEPVLLENASVTGLVEMKLKPNVRRSQIVATVRFRYRNVIDGSDQIVVKNIRARHFEHTWLQATRRHRLATLGAVWGESLQGTAFASDVAKSAEQLATEAPGDSRARELAAAASASSRLQTSVPTGSGH